MRSVALFGRKHGGKKLELIAGPSSDGKELVAVIQAFKNETRTGVHKTYELVEIWEGRLKQRKMISETDAKRRSEAEAKAKAEKAKAEAAKVK